MSNEKNLIRTMVRGTYDLQAVRVQMGNRITGNFKAKLGLTQDGMSEKQLEAADKKVLDVLRASYKRITDGIVLENQNDPESDFGAIVGKIPTRKKFKGDEIISEYTELVLVDQYMTLLFDEEKQFSNLKSTLKGIPIYDKFLEGVSGIGPAIAGVIISEIDITKAEYPSSLWKYSGLDSVTVVKYTDDKGKEHTVPAWKVDAHFNGTNSSQEFLADGKYPVTFESVGRSRKDFCLVEKEYINKDKELAVRNSITFNPFLKTKLIGVLGTSFLRSGTSIVDGKKMGAAKRLELAKEEGFVSDLTGDDLKEIVLSFLRNSGHDVNVSPSKYGKFYYDYRNRLNNDPRHNEKTILHKHNMSIRFMIKRFLVDLYSAWRAYEGLPVATEYSEGVLGKIHGQAKAA